MERKNKVSFVTHEFGPYYQTDSQILILGSFPSVKSREQGFYYMHPQNRFWKVLACVFEEMIPNTIEERKHFLKRHHIALWDVVECCDIKGSSDASIEHIVPTDIKNLLEKTKIKTIVTTGKKAYELYERYSKPNTNIDAISLPSTSSANIANYTLEQLVECYTVIREVL